MEAAAVKVKKDFAKVIRVIDGDTIRAIVNDKEVSVRMLLIDTPETRHPSKPKEPYGKEASNFTKEKLKTNSYVYLEYEKYRKDMYGRLLAYIWYRDKAELKLIQEQILLEGLAKVSHTNYPQKKYLDLFLEAESMAKLNKKNLWSNE